MSNALVPVSSTAAARRDVCTAGRVSYEGDELVIRLRPSDDGSHGVPREPVDVTATPAGKRKFDEWGPVDSPLHPRNRGRGSSLRYVWPADRDPRQQDRTVRCVERSAARRNWLAVKWQKYGACPWWVRWAYRWLP